MRKTGCGWRMAALCLLIGLAVCACTAGHKNADMDVPKRQFPAADNQGNRKFTGLYPASVNSIGGNKWGYIDKTGKFIIQPKFSLAEDFQDNGLAVVTEGDLTGSNLSGVINDKGEFVIEPQYDHIDKFSEGAAVAVGKKGFTVVNEKGEKLFESGDYVGGFHDGLAVFSKNVESGGWLCGYIDNAGKVAIEPKFEIAGDFHNGKAVVKLDTGGCAVIGKNGEIITTFNYGYVGDIGDGMLVFKEKDSDLFGYMDEQGKVMISPRFSGAEPFKDGVAIVNVSGNYEENLYGLINKKGEYVIKPEYNDMRMLGEGMVAVGIPLDRDNLSKGNKYAVANREGKLLTDFIYYGVSDFEGEYASAYDNTSTFFIDKSGKKVEDLPVFKGSGTLQFDGELIKADVDNRISYLDKNGNVIWQSKADVVLNGQYTIEEMKYRPNRNYLAYYPRISGIADETARQEINEKLEKMAIPEKVDGDAELDYSYQGDYGIEMFKKNLLVIKFTGYTYPFGTAHGMPNKSYAHLDLKSGKLYQLKDLFKANGNYVEKLSRLVGNQIKTQGEEPEIWADSYKGIRPDQPFIITDRALKLYFLPYEIAPYAVGFPEFTIPYEKVKDIINAEGSFWKAFN
ncbi:MAG: WG repeat-containing protein [Clostridiales bacterium]|nr:WG repeat-containing protein [Eubacteriales bacterium]MDH7566627.1 WG repeat-containing protein [Clostridiales bacterium]